MSRNSSPHSKRVSIKELAARLNTSVCTVSKALHNQPKVSEKTRAKVLAMAKQLGYKPNIAASTMARRPPRVAWVYPAAWPSYHQPMLDGAIFRAASLSDFNITVTPYPCKEFTKVSSCLKSIEKARKDGFDALCVCSGSYSSEEQKQLTEMLLSIEKAVVFLGSSEIPQGGKICNIRQHSLRAGEIAGNLATILLAGQKEATAGLVIGNVQVNSHQEKISGFRSMLSKGGIEFAGYAESRDATAGYCDATKLFLQKNPRLGVLYVGTENLQSCLDNIKELGLFGKIKIIATGISEVVNQGLKDGYIQFAIDEKAFDKGMTAIDAVCRKLFHNEEIAGKILVEPSIRVACLLNDSPKSPGNHHRIPFLS